MNQKFLEQNKAKLEAEKKKLLELMSEVGHKTSEGNFAADFPNKGDSDDDNAQEVNEYAVNIGEEKIFEVRLKKVSKALERIAKGTYGKCSVGGEDIDVKRLEVMPEAETCATHAQN
jgi:RNA polymerase-binding transcription factor DksA